MEELLRLEKERAAPEELARLEKEARRLSKEYTDCGCDAQCSYCEHARKSYWADKAVECQRAKMSSIWSSTAASAPAASATSSTSTETATGPSSQAPVASASRCATCITICKRCRHLSINDKDMIALSEVSTCAGDFTVALIQCGLCGDVSASVRSLPSSDDGDQ